jgi:4-hydroxybutyryl-CoA dehydratase/vinylacetyl-CoA-Delta-isomerase
MLTTGSDYLASLADGREIYYDGTLVRDVASHPRFRTAAGRVAATYDSEFAVGRAGQPPRPEDLIEQTSPAAQKDMTRHTTTTALLAIQSTATRLRTALPARATAMQAFVDRAIAGRRRCALCITDAKGDRQQAPGKQEDLDQYLHVVDQRGDGIVVRGAKLHIRGAALVHDLIVLPTKAMKHGEEEWAVAFAVPVSSPGIRILNVVPGPAAEPGDHTTRFFPFSWDRNDPIGFVVFDDVFVPWDRVFLCGETEYSAVLLHNFGPWERITSANMLLGDADLFVGLGQLLAEANGITRFSHVKDKLSELILYATTIRGLVEAAWANPDPRAEVRSPSELFTNTAKHYACANVGNMITILQDLAGGAIINAPLPGDLQEPQTAPWVRKYMRGAAGFDGEYRTRLMWAVRDIVADSFTGHWLVTQLQGGGGPQAMRLLVRKSFGMAKARQDALRAAGLSPPETVAAS